MIHWPLKQMVFTETGNKPIFILAPLCTVISNSFFFPDTRPIRGKAYSSWWEFFHCHSAVTTCYVHFWGLNTGLLVRSITPAQCNTGRLIKVALLNNSTNTSSENESLCTPTRIEQTPKRMGLQAICKQGKPMPRNANQQNIYIMHARILKTVDGCCGGLDRSSLLLSNENDTAQFTK